MMRRRRAPLTKAIMHASPSTSQQHISRFRLSYQRIISRKYVRGRQSNRTRQQHSQSRRYTTVLGLNGEKGQKILLCFLWGGRYREAPNQVRHTHAPLLMTSFWQYLVASLNFIINIFNFNFLSTWLDIYKFNKSLKLENFKLTDGFEVVKREPDVRNVPCQAAAWWCSLSLIISCMELTFFSHKRWQC